MLINLSSNTEMTAQKKFHETGFSNLHTSNRIPTINGGRGKSSIRISLKIPIDARMGETLEKLGLKFANNSL